MQRCHVRISLPRQIFVPEERAGGVERGAHWLSERSPARYMINPRKCLKKETLCNHKQADIMFTYPSLSLFILI